MAAISIPQYEKQLELRQQQLEQAERQVSAFDPRLLLTQRQLRERKDPLREKVRAKEIERKRELAKRKSVAELQKEYEKQRQLEAKFRPIKARYEAYQKALAQQRAYETAREYFLRGKSASLLKGTPSYMYIKKMYKRQELLGSPKLNETYIQQLEKQIGYKLSREKIREVVSAVEERRPTTLAPLAFIPKFDIRELIAPKEVSPSISAPIITAPSIAELEKQIGYKLSPTKIREVISAVEEGRPTTLAPIDIGLPAYTGALGVGIDIYGRPMIGGKIAEMPYIEELKRTDSKQYELYKKLEKAKIQEQAQLRYELETPYKELLEKGELPSIIRKGAYEIGAKYFEAIEKVTPLPPLTEAEVEKYGVAFGTVFLGLAVSPAIKYAGSGQIQKQISKTRFEAIKDSIGKIERTVAEKKNLGEQLKYLKKIKDNLKTDQAKRNFENFVRDLIDRQVLKIPRYEVGIQPAITRTIFEEVVRDVPAPMEYAGLLLGLVPSLKPKEKEKFKSEFEIKQKEALRTAQAIVPAQLDIQLEKQIIKQREKQKLVTLQLLGQIPRLAQAPALKQPSRLGQAQPQILKQPTRQIQRPTPRITPRPRPPPKRPIPFLLPKVKKKKPKIKKVRKRKELVVPFVRRYRKWIKIGEPMPKREAIIKGIARLRMTLAASLQLRRPTGEVVPFAKPTKEFRLGKKAPEILVQRAPRRLKAPEEVREIIAARKRRVKFI